MKFIRLSKQNLFKILLVFSLFFFFSGKEIEDAEIPDSPLSLTAGDGAGLVLKGYESNTVLDGFIAFTEIKLKFYNPENRQREGRFRITLPDNAHLARFAMQIDGRWQEGEVVEKEKAVRAYEDFLHRKQDPALLESDAGNEFSARIFPIPAKGDKDLIVSYSTVLDTEPPQYTIPLVGLPEIDNFKVTVLYDEKEFQQENQKTTPVKDEGNTVNRKVFSIQKKNYKPERDYAFEHKTKGNLYLKNESLFALHFVPFKESSSEKFKSEKGVFLIDTSASAAIRYKEHLEKLEEVIKKLGLKEIHIFGFDNKLTYYGDSIEDLKKLEKILPLGASNLYSALKGISSKADVKDARLFLVSDGVATAGNIEKAKIAELVKSQKWISRLDFIIPGTYKDAGLIKKIIPLGKNPGTSVELGDELDSILKKINRKVYTDNKISIAGAKWFYPDTLDSIQPGDPVVVFGELKDKSGNPSKDIQFNGKPVDSFTNLTMDELLLEREAMAARINRLIDLSEKEQNEDTAKGFELQARELSIKHRIQSPFTSFLVLETEADYQRFQITRNSLTNILTIGVGGLEVINRRNSKNYEFLNEEKIEEAKRTKQEEANRLAKNHPKKKAKGKSGNSSTPANGSIAMKDSLEVEEDEDDASMEEPRRSSDKMSPPSPASQPMREKDVDRKKMDESVTSGKSSVADTKPSPKPEMKTEELKKEISVEKPQQTTANTVIPTRDEVEPLPERERRKLESIRRPPPRPRPEPEEKREKVEPYTGNMKKFQSLLDKKELKKAYQFALDWRIKSPDDALALIALGDAFDKLGDKPNTIRAYTSLVDYFPKRADIRRWAGEKLMSIGEYDDAIDTLNHALTQRPDHPSSYHLLAIAYIKDKQYKAAAGIALKGINFQFDGRFGAVHDILYDDLDLAYSLAMKTDSKDKEYFTKIKSEYKMKQLTKEIRFILVWETDANDVDFHIYDKNGNHAFYSSMELASGGALYADLTGGYGPECFRIINPLAFPYKLEAHYYSRGPMGYGMGAVQIIRYDGDKDLEVDTRDYVIMNDGAFLDLGSVKE